MTTPIPFVQYQSALPFLRYGYFRIWPWKSMVKVLHVIRGEGHFDLPSFHFTTIDPAIPKIQRFRSYLSQRKESVLINGVNSKGMPFIWTSNRAWDAIHPLTIFMNITWGFSRLIAITLWYCSFFTIVSFILCLYFNNSLSRKWLFYVWSYCIYTCIRKELENSMVRRYVIQ